MNPNDTLNLFVQPIYQLFLISKSNVKGGNDVECEILPGPAVGIHNNLLRPDSNIIFETLDRSESVICTF